MIPPASTLLEVSAMPRWRHGDGRLGIEVLDPRKHRREGFLCESPAVTDFLKTRARKEMDARASACFVLVEEADPGRIVGYYPLSQTSVSVGQLPAMWVKRLPPHAYTQDQLVEQPAIGLFAELGWTVAFYFFASAASWLRTRIAPVPIGSHPVFS